MLNVRLYVRTCHANLTNQCLLNIAFSMTKELNNRSSPKQNFHSLHFSILPSFQCYFESPATINACFPLFHTLFFIPFFIHHFLFNFVKFQLIPVKLRFRGLWANQMQ